MVLLHHQWELAITPQHFFTDTALHIRKTALMAWKSKLLTTGRMVFLARSSGFAIPK